MRVIQKKTRYKVFGSSCAGCRRPHHFADFVCFLQKTAPSAEDEKGNYSAYTANRAFDLDAVYQDLV